VTNLHHGPHASAPGFRHEALIHRDDGQFLCGTAGFVREGLAADDAVLVAALAPRIALLREELGVGAKAVEFFDLGDLGRNPARILPFWRDWVDRHGGRGRAMRGVCEPPLSGRGTGELLECRRQEHLLNTEFRDGPAWSLLCPYDAGRLPGEVVAWAAHTHPVLTEDGQRRASGSYRAPGGAADAVTDAPLPEPEPGALIAVLDFDFAALSAVRALIRVHAADLGLDEAGVLDFTLVVSELAANSVRHGGGSGTLRLWRQGPYAVCEVRDRGVLTDPLVGTRRPDFRRSAGGAGLWTVNRICDLVLIRSGRERGTVVRAHLAAAR
jgi:anti-sigma regulatory factor (Ser/Thr protein kinase)